MDEALIQCDPGEAEAVARATQGDRQVGTGPHWSGPATSREHQGRSWRRQGGVSPRALAGRGHDHAYSALWPPGRREDTLCCPRPPGVWGLAPAALRDSTGLAVAQSPSPGLLSLGGRRLFQGRGLHSRETLVSPMCDFSVSPDQVLGYDPKVGVWLCVGSRPTVLCSQRDPPERANYFAGSARPWLRELVYLQAR